MHIHLRVLAAAVHAALCACAAGHREHGAPDNSTSTEAGATTSAAAVPPARPAMPLESDSGPAGARTRSPAAGSSAPEPAADPAADGGSAGTAGSSSIADAASASDDAGTSDALAPNDEWLGGGKPVPCTTDDDCRKSLFTPVCGAVSRLCEVCPDPEQERALALRVNACILAASPRCLDDEDCRFAGCITTCDGP